MGALRSGNLVLAETGWANLFILAEGGALSMALSGGALLASSGQVQGYSRKSMQFLHRPQPKVRQVIYSTHKSMYSSILQYRRVSCICEHILIHQEE